MLSGDAELDDVFEKLLGLDPYGERTARVLRETLDQLYDGQHTGRYRWDQLHKTEKTHCGTLVEINLHREFQFDDGEKLDYSIGSVDVDCKYSQKLGGWMIPKEAYGKLCLLVTANDEASTWSAGLVRADEALLGPGRNRDAKAALSKEGRDAIRWLHKGAELPPNVLLDLSPHAQDAIFGELSGQKRVDELFRQTLGRRVGRGVVATVAQQSDYMKRVRSNGGSRTRLQPEGIVVLGDAERHRVIAQALGVEVPEQGESVAVRVAPAQENWVGPTFEAEGTAWRLATPSDAVRRAPKMENPRVARPTGQ
ncbi:hypothetical protein DUHN55_29670 [Helicobacter pylori]